ncbi:MAG: cyclohexanone monooxygenase, partial [Gammaproteobacteria bacterium]
SVHEVDHATRYPHVASWYTGTNIPGKRCQFSPYADGVGTYRRACEDLVARDYAGVGFQRHT